MIQEFWEDPRGGRKPVRRYYKNGHRHKGTKHWNWQGGKHGHSQGYLRVWNKGTERILEHRYVMEQHLGRKLEDWEHVHHINGNKTDNRIENLKLVTNTEHGHIHTKDMSKRKCYYCGSNKTRKYRDSFVWYKHKHVDGEFICKYCYDYRRTHKK